MVVQFYVDEIKRVLPLDMVGVSFDLVNLVNENVFGNVDTTMGVCVSGANYYGEDFMQIFPIQPKKLDFLWNKSGVEKTGKEILNGLYEHFSTFLYANIEKAEYNMRFSWKTYIPDEVEDGVK